MNSELLKSIEGFAADQKFAVGNDLVFIPDFKHSLKPLFKSKALPQQRSPTVSGLKIHCSAYASTWAAGGSIQSHQTNRSVCPVLVKN